MRCWLVALHALSTCVEEENLRYRNARAELASLGYYTQPVQGFEESSGARGHPWLSATAQQELVPYEIAHSVRTGADGPFTVSLWFRGNGSDTSGELFEYIFSHSAYATRTLPSPVSSFQANQVRLSVPRHFLFSKPPPLHYVFASREILWPGLAARRPSLAEPLGLRSGLRQRLQRLQGCAQSVSGVGHDSDAFHHTPCQWTALQAIVEGKPLLHVIPDGEHDCLHVLQIHMFLPEDAHPAHGLLRSVVKDSTDPDTNVFVDSDGHVNDNTPRVNGTFLNMPLTNGNWHMATLTSRPNGTRGRGPAQPPHDLSLTAFM